MKTISYWAPLLGILAILSAAGCADEADGGATLAAVSGALSGDQDRLDRDDGEESDDHDGDGDDGEGEEGDDDEEGDDEEGDDDGQCVPSCTTGSVVCDDGDACTVDACDPNVGCTATAISIDDNNVCTDDACDPILGVTHTNNAATCSDGDACTALDVCSGGTCVGGNPVVCAATDACHAPGICDGATGLCSNPIGVPGGVLDNAGACCLPAALDCAGQCNGPAEVDCAGQCDGGKRLTDWVYFTTDAGVFRWSSAHPTLPATQLSTWPSYAIAISPVGGVVVGTGGLEASSQGLTTPGIYAIDSAGVASLLAGVAAEDLQFAPNGTLHAANIDGIFAIDGVTGAASQVSTHPTSQFAFESNTEVITTNGSVYAPTFGAGTERLDLVTDTATLLNANGGEDVTVNASGLVVVAGQGGVFELSTTGAFSNIYSQRKAFNIGFGRNADLYLGNSATYGPLSWPQGLYAPSISTTAIDSADINAMVVAPGCE